MYAVGLQLHHLLVECFKQLLRFWNILRKRGLGGAVYDKFGLGVFVYPASGICLIILASLCR